MRRDAPRVHLLDFEDPCNSDRSFRELPRHDPSSNTWYFAWLLPLLPDIGVKTLSSSQRLGTLPRGISSVIDPERHDLVAITARGRKRIPLLTDPNNSF